MTKGELRKIFTQKRNSLTEAECLTLNRRLCENFFAMMDLGFTRVLHSYLPIEKNKEPDTWLIIDRIRRDFSHIRLSVPRINSTTRELDNFFLDGLDQLQTNSWGIPEPTKGIPTETSKIDMVLLPLLAFDKQGHRVGYGKGFYDKLLSNVKPECRRVGLSLFTPVDIIDDVQEFDISLHQCVTPDGVFSFV